VLGYLKTFSRSDAVQNLRSEILKNRRNTKNLNLTLENYHNQVQSLEILLTQCINFYETLKGSREDFNRKYKISSEKGDSAIQNFTDGIET
jgi:predicted RNase H-like nuclease (RuvC/YqgF family)